MKLPALMPEELQVYGRVDSEEELLAFLKEKPSDLIRFFEYVCGDETWSGVEHPNFTHELIRFLTDQAHHDRLDRDSIFFVAANIHDHFENLQTLIPKEMTVVLEDGESKTNSLLFQAVSDYFHSRYRVECLKQEEARIRLDTSLQMFELINEFILHGQHPLLWRQEPEVLFKMIDTSRDLEVEEAALQAEDVLKRYIDPANVFDYMMRAQTKRWPHLRSACMEYINHLESDLRLLPSDLNQFFFEFVVISEDALDFFRKLNQLITHLLFRERLPEDSHFGEIVTSCPQLRGVDLSDTLSFNDNLLLIPEEVKELSLVNCQWLDDACLKQMLNHITGLEKLNLRSNVHLNVSTWALLRHYPHLISLNLGRCSQIRDGDLKVILDAGKSLVDLNLEDCGGITDAGFTDLARSANELVFLNLSKTNIGDGALAEMGENLKRLVSIDLSRCEGMTLKGVLDLVRGATQLKVIHLHGVPIDAHAVKTLKQARPSLTIIP